MQCKIIYDNTSLLEKDIADIGKHPETAFRIRKKIEDFAENPLGFIGNIKKLEPKKNNIYRMRVGDYRIVFSLDFGNQIMIIHRIGLRKDVYK